MRTSLRRELGLTLSVAALLATQFGTIGCSKDDKPEVTDPVFPGELPSPATMQIDVSDLSDAGSPALSGPCHAESAFLVTVANALVVVALATPVAVLGVTVQQEPVYAGNQTWRWTASGGSGGNAWSSEFDGHVANPTTVEWTMRVSGTPLGLDEFVWYTGISNVAASSGSWTFYDPLDLGEIGETLYSTYAIVSEDTATLTFEDRNDNGSGFGNELTYDAAGDDLSVSFLSATEDATFAVEWSRSTGAGEQTDFQGERCCWGARPDFDDVQCP